MVPIKYREDARGDSPVVSISKNKIRSGSIGKAAAGSANVIVSVMVFIRFLRL